MDGYERLPARVGGGAGRAASEDALAAGLRRVRDRDFNYVCRETRPLRFHRTRRAARLAALVLPFDRHGVGRDVAGAAWRDGVAGARRVVRSLTRPTDRDGVLVSRRHRCVWWMTAKVATQSIQAAMLGSDPDCSIFSMGVPEFYRMRPEARGWFSFAFVRHPFSRALSFWWDVHFAHERYTEQVEWLKRKRAHLFKHCHGLADTRDFDAYCRWLHTPYGADACADRHILSLGAQIRDAGGRLPDFVGRLEDFAADWSRVAARAGLPVREPPLLHSLVGWEAAPEVVEAARASRAALLLTERNKALLAARYAGDLKLGGYSPTSLKTIAGDCEPGGHAPDRSVPPADRMSAAARS